MISSCLIVVLTFHVSSGLYQPLDQANNPHALPQKHAVEINMNQFAALGPAPSRLEQVQRTVQEKLEGVGERVQQHDFFKKEKEEKNDIARLRQLVRGAMQKGEAANVIPQQQHDKHLQQPSDGDLQQQNLQPQQPLDERLQQHEQQPQQHHNEHLQQNDLQPQQHHDEHIQQHQLQDNRQQQQLVPKSLEKQKQNPEQKQQSRQDDHEHEQSLQQQNNHQGKADKRSGLALILQAPSKFAANSDRVMAQPESQRRSVSKRKDDTSTEKSAPNDPRNRRIDVYQNPRNPNKFVYVDKDLNTNVVNITTKEFKQDEIQQHQEKKKKKENGLVRFVKSVAHGIKKFLSKSYHFFANLFHHD